MKHLFTTLFLIFYLSGYSQDSLIYHSMNIRAEYVLDSLGIPYIPLDVRNQYGSFRFDIDESKINNFMNYHSGNLEYTPNQYSVCYELPEYNDMFGGEYTLIGGLKIETNHDKIIGHTDVLIDGKVIRIIETKNLVQKDGRKYFFFDSMVFIMDSDGQWTKVNGKRDSLPHGWNPFYY